MSEKLKQCPFCGGEAELCYSEVDTFCRKCNVIQETEMWNTRPIEDALNARIAELEDALNARIAELEAERRWIPVSERLPEEKQSVLALDRTGTAYHWEYSRSLSNIFVSDYTHWMPLPGMPEAEE